MTTRGPSMRDIATASGVSLSTVSRYLRGQLALRADTEQRVLTAVARLGYVPRGAKTERSSRTPHVVALILPELRNSYFGTLGDEIIRAAQTHGLQVVVISTIEHPLRQEEAVDLARSLGVKGIIYSGNYVSNPALVEAARGLPTVVVDEAIDNVPSSDSVVVDDYAGAYQATALLTSLGHRRIAYVGGPTELHSVQHRKRGWMEALAAVGESPGPELHGSFTPEFGTDALVHLVSGPEPPTAIFAASDTIALGILAAARTLDLDVPGDLSLVGFDDAEPAGFVTPRLTTVRTPLQTMAETATALLASRIKEPDRAPRKRVTPVRLVRGASVAPPSASGAHGTPIFQETTSRQAPNDEATPRDHSYHVRSI